MQSAKAYACLSEDMDMFAYGCPIVLRYLSLLNSCVVLYDLNTILSTLGYSLEEFKYLCVLSGTDYNDNMLGAYKAVDMLSQFKKSEIKDTSFSKWLADNKYADMFIKTMYMFDLSAYDLDREKLVESNADIPGRRSFLREYGFIFID